MEKASRVVYVPLFSGETLDSIQIVGVSVVEAPLPISSEQSDASAEQPVADDSATPEAVPEEAPAVPNSNSDSSEPEAPLTTVVKEIAAELVATTAKAEAEADSATGNNCEADDVSTTTTPAESQPDEVSPGEPEGEEH